MRIFLIFFFQVCTEGDTELTGVAVKKNVKPAQRAKRTKGNKIFLNIHRGNFPLI